MPVHAAWYRSAAGWAPAAIGAGGPGDVGQLTAVTPAGARLIAVGDARLFASVDGGSWDPLPGDVAAGSTISVAWGGGRLLSVGNAADSAQFRLSSDGATWVDVTPQDARAARVLGLTFRDGLFVAVGGGGGGARSWLSLDGETWQVGRSIDGGTGAEMADVVWGSGSFVAVGARGTDAAIWSGEVTRP
jgi:hypothetical protein